MSNPFFLIMKKRYRIKKNSEIDAIFKQKIIKGDGYFVIYQKNDLDQTHFRFALSIGRKYGKAVDRNLAKRRIRMIVSEQKERIFPNKQFVIVIKPLASSLNYQEIKTKLIDLMIKSKLMETTHE